MYFSQINSSEKLWAPRETQQTVEALIEAFARESKIEEKLKSAPQKQPHQK